MSTPRRPAPTTPSPSTRTPPTPSPPRLRLHRSRQRRQPGGRPHRQPARRRHPHPRRQPGRRTDVVRAADLGNLVFTPDANANGAGYASFTFSVEDDNGAFAASPSTLTVDVTPVNDPPAGADNTVTIDEDTAHTFSATDFGFTDPDSGDSLAAVRIDSLPAAGTLTLDGNTVAEADVVLAADIGNLVFTPDPDANGAGYASFTFSVEDDNGAFAASPSTLTVDVTPVNDPPAITSDGGGATAAVDVAENNTAVTTVTATIPTTRSPSPSSAAPTRRCSPSTRRAARSPSSLRPTSRHLPMTATTTATRSSSAPPIAT